MLLRILCSWSVGKLLSSYVYLSPYSFVLNSCKGSNDILYYVHHTLTFFFHVLFWPVSMTWEFSFSQNHLLFYQSCLNRCVKCMQIKVDPWKTFSLKWVHQLILVFCFLFSSKYLLWYYMICNWLNKQIRNFGFWRPSAKFCFPGGSEGKVSACNVGDSGLTPVSGRSPGEGNGGPFQYSCLENPMDGGAWWATVRGVTKSRIHLSKFTFCKILWGLLTS